MKYIFRGVYIVVIVVLLAIFFTSKGAYTATSLNTKSAKEFSNIDLSLQDKIKTWETAQSKDYTIAVRELTGQKRIASTNIFQKMPTASTYKLFVAYAVLHEVEQGNLKLSHMLSSGDTVKSCLQKMIVLSDNPCGRSLGFLVGWEKIEKLLESKGIDNTYLNNYDENDQLLTAEKTSTAQAHSKFLQLLHDGKLLNTSNTELLLGYMEKQQWRERIPAGVPKDIKIADKPGFLPGMQNDAAIVYGPRSTYVLVVLSNSNNPASLAEISTIVYDYLQK